MAAAPGTIIAEDMAMTAALKKTAPFAVLTLAAVTLAGCVLGPAPYYEGEGEAYYARPAPVYVAPGYYYGSHRGYWYRHGWRGGRWKGNGHHWH
jgi:hypothetical protein